MFIDLDCRVRGIEKYLAMNSKCIMGKQWGNQSFRLRVVSPTVCSPTSTLDSPTYCTVCQFAYVLNSVLWQSFDSCLVRRIKKTNKQMLQRKISSESSDLEQGWRSGESTRLSLTDVARVRFWAPTICRLSLLLVRSQLREVFPRVLRFSSLLKNQHF